MYSETAPTLTPPPAELLPAWPRAQRVARRHATASLPSIAALRARGCLSEARAERITAWYTGPPVADPPDVERAYRALAGELVALGRAITIELGVRVTLVESLDEPYADASALCADLRERGAMHLRAASADAPHPFLPDTAVDRLRMVHDVLGHAALGLGFDLQSEYAAWLWCRSLFSSAARPAAFCELAGTVTAYVLTGVKPGFRPDLPPPGLCASERAEVVAQRARQVLGPHEAAALQRGHQAVGDLGDPAPVQLGERQGDEEPVATDLLHHRGHLIGGLVGRAHHLGVAPFDRDLP
jgi:hypothetical protein